MISQRENRWVRRWLISGVILIMAMVVIGGVTRLTHSGLSMVEWKPIMGTLPPLNHAQWETAFQKYRQYPEFKTFNSNMTLSGFKAIFFWEYLHRTVGRLTGLVFFIPLIIFWVKKWIRPHLWRRLGWITLVGLLQGFAGWTMVKSGLVDRPDVSHFRLALHLVLAVSLLTLVFRACLNEIKVVQPNARNPIRMRWLRITQVIVGIQIIYGAFTAGLDGGIGYNTFPLMNGHLLPAGFGALSPWWMNLVNGPHGIQFIHRTIGWIILFLIVGQGVYFLRRVTSETEKRLELALIFWVVAQFSLGVMTLLFVVPVSVAALHQLGAMILWLLLQTGEWHQKVYLGGHD